MPASKGDVIPNTTFSYIPWSPDLESGKACGVPTTFQSHDRWKGKKVVIVSIPGAFTPVCHVHHIPGFMAKQKELKSKGVDEIVVIAANDAFVMSAWGVNQGGKDDLVFASDVDAKFSQGLGATLDLSAKGMGTRTARYALIVDDLKVVDLSIDEGELSQSSAEAVLSKL